MKRHGWLLAAFVLTLAATLFAEPPTAPPDEPGIVPVGRAYFPMPGDARVIEMPNGNFEQVENNRPAGWDTPRATIGPDADTPHGGRYLRVPEGVESWITGPQVELQPNRFYFMSFWLRSNRNVSGDIAVPTAPETRGLGVRWVTYPSTEGQWRRTGYYFRMPDGAQKAGFRLRVRGEADDGLGPVDLADVRLRTVSDTEFIGVHGQWRQQYPEHDLAPRATDGRSLALSVEKLEGRGVPGKPFVIWAIGSSFTNFQGNGETLIANLRQRFPNAPEIRYRKHVGNGTPWQYMRGWARQFVAYEQPDLILIYTIGQPIKLQETIKDIQSLCTADIVVPSIHLRMNEALTPESIASPTWEAVRSLCENYQAEFVDNRREWAEFIDKYGLDKGDLMADNVHQNALGALVINENIVRHFAQNDAPSYDPRDRERRLIAAGPEAQLRDDRLVFEGQWWRRDDAPSMAAEAAGARATLTFTGTRADLIGRRLPGGGSVEGLINGKPAAEAPAFVMTYILPGANNAGPAWPRGDKAPHAVDLRENVVPQTWTITMTSDAGDYELTGSVTGPDGKGNALKYFTGESGQIGIDPEFWRGISPIRSGPDQGQMRFGSKQGDTYTFEVKRAVTESVSFDAGGAEEGDLFVVPLARNLPTGIHRIDLVLRGDGPVAVDSLYVYQPPLVREP